jgi:hypothetical protein
MTEMQQQPVTQPGSSPSPQPSLAAAPMGTLSIDTDPSPLAVSVLDHESKTVAQVVSPALVRLPSGLYMVRASRVGFPDLTQFAWVVSNSKRSVHLSENAPSLRTAAATVVSGLLDKYVRRIPTFTPVQTIEPDTGADKKPVQFWIRFLCLKDWDNAEHIELPSFSSRNDGRKTLLDITNPHQHVLFAQISQPGVRTVNVATPPAGALWPVRCHLVVVSEADLLQAHIRLATEWANAALQYMSQGHYAEAKQLAETAIEHRLSRAAQAIENVADWFANPQRPTRVGQIVQQVIDRFDDPAAALVPRYIGLRTRDDSVFNTLGDFLLDVIQGLSDGLVISAEIAARGNQHKMAASRILSIPAGGLPLFTDGFSMLLHRVKELVELDASEIPPDQRPGPKETEQLNDLLRTLMKWAPFVNVNSPTLTFRGNDLTAPKESEAPLTPKLSDGWILGPEPRKGLTVVVDTATAPDGTRPEFGARFKFHEVFEAEIALINRRRAQSSRDPIELETESPEDLSGEPVLAPAENANVVGLALSGGGIRSAAFCLGVLQALEAADVLKHVDYMSTVSGGGYIGCALTAALEWSKIPGWPVDKFPFTSRLKEDEPPSLQHIRDHSNYLFANGAIDLLHNASIYARGLAINAVLVAPFLLGASALTLLAYAAAGSNLAKLHIFGFLNPFGLMHFVVTVDLALLLVVVGIAWGMFQSTRARQRELEIPGSLTRWVGALVIVFFVSAFCEAQPFVLGAMAKTSPTSLVESVLGKINKISALLAPVGAVIAFLASKIGEFVKSATESPKVRVQMVGFAAKVAVYFAGLIVPFVLWVIYLNVTLWGLSAKGSWYLVPAFYSAAAFLIFILTLFMRPNANSLHPLYRDHLGKAFIFKPETRSEKKDLDQWRPLLSDITLQYGPYHLINTALNVQDSKTANRRGRNADFFVFTPRFLGSKSTGYVATRDAEDVAVGLDLPTAMAVSGAAVSSSMGAQSINPLTATLALLNIRLGYWMRNPLRLKEAKPLRPQSRFRAVAEFRRKRNFVANYYFLAELFGLLSDQFRSVYLTDGGHIENLGIYELLRRRCRVIIAVDAEADPQMAFGSFNTLERYALIDLGIRIDLPWQEVTNESLATGKEIDEKGDAEKHHGPHCAIGEINYPGGRKGILIYIKASITGDENDYIFHYKKRYGDFPHETTLDQMFSEEQFEAYRALGFHAAYGLFDRSDSFAHLDPVTNDDVRKQIADLDQLFPRIASENPPRQKQAFAEWLPRARRPQRRRADNREGT